MGIDIQVGNSSVAFKETLLVAGHITIHNQSYLVSTFQLLVWYVITGVTGGNYKVKPLDPFPVEENMSPNVAAHTSSACRINLTPQTIAIYLGRTEQRPWCDKSTSNL